MAGAITFTEMASKSYSVKSVLAEWTSDASGDATGTTTESYEGEIIYFATIPDTSTGLIPSPLYDIVVRDSDGFDVLAGEGGDRASGVEEEADDVVLGATNWSKLAFTISNAGNVTAGAIKIWIR